jgi:hypothetical protein
MLALKFLLMTLGFALFASAAILVAYDVYAATRLRWLLRRNYIVEAPSAASHHHRPTLLWVARAATLEERP